MAHIHLVNTFYPGCDIGFSYKSKGLRCLRSRLSTIVLLVDVNLSMLPMLSNDLEMTILNLLACLLPGHILQSKLDRQNGTGWRRS